MRLNTGEIHIELRGREVAVRAELDMAGLRGDTDVSTEEPVDIINDAGCHHGARASRPFFRRLEDQLDAAAEPILVIREPVRNTEADRGVGVVAAGVHLAFEGRKASVGPGRPVSRIPTQPV